ncbi:MAG: T9SS type A sorting domain-containing protein [Bacteroidia bacterium]|nr:T9SS type A sorting domain-containing protein [Bacteroidia bacterium]
MLKALSLVVIGVLTAGTTHAQCTTYDFSSSAGWTQVNTGVAISSSQVTFTGAADGSVPRFVHTTFSPALSNTSWYCDFDFTPVSGNGPAHTLIAFTPSTPAVYNASGNYSPPPMKYSNMHCIEVAILGPAGNTNPSDWWIYAGAKQFNSSFAAGYTLTTPPVWSTSANIDLPSGSAGVKRYVRIQRLDATRCKLSMYSDAARTVLMGSSCFTIPAAVGGLNAVQVGNKPEGSPTRTFSGSVDNITFCNLNPSLTGPSNICSNVSGLYKLSNGNSSVTADCGFPGATGFTWSAPAGSTLGSGTGGTCFTSGTGNGSQNGINVVASGVITCVVNYGCATVTFTRSVTVSNPPTAVFSMATNQCLNAAIMVNGSASTNETNYFWSAAPCDASGVITGSWVNQATQTGTAGSYNITPLLNLPPFAVCSLNYRIKLTTSNPVCGTTVSSLGLLRLYRAPDMGVSLAPFICPDSCATISVNATCGSPTTYTWSPAAGLSCTNCTSPVACPSTSTTYTVTGSNPGCPSATAIVPVTVSTLSVNAGPDLILCCNLFDTLVPVVSGGTPPYTIVWSPVTDLFCPGIGVYTPGACTSPVLRTCTPGIYTVTVTDAAGCTVTDQVNISIITCRLGSGAENGNASATGQITVFPNPASNEVKVNVEDEVAGLIEITDLTGRVVMQTRPQTNLVVLNVAELPEGSYLIRVITSGRIETHEVIISR